MSGLFPFGSQNAFSLLGYSPSGNSKSAPVSVVLTPANGSQVENLTNLPGGNQIGSIVSLFIDNSQGGVPVEVEFPDTSQIIICPAYSQGYFPCLTASLIFTVSAPLIGVLNGNVPVEIQVANFPLPVAAYGPFTPSQNAGQLQFAGVNTGWSSYSGTVPALGAAQAIFSSLEIDCTAIGCQVSMSSTDINGEAWTVNQMPLTKGEFYIPATASGTPYTATITVPNGGNSDALVPLRWRVAPIGEQASYNIPLYMPSIVQTYTSMPSGNTSETVFAPAAGEGVFIDSISITAQGWTVPWNFLLEDVGYPGTLVITEQAFPAGNVTYQQDVGYVSYKRDAIVGYQYQGTGAGAGILAVNVRGSYLAASQNG